MRDKKRQTALMVGWELEVEPEINQTLEKLGYQVIAATDNNNAINLITRTPPEFIFIKLRSDRIESQHLLETFIKAGQQSRIVVVDLSPSIQVMKRILHLNVFDYFANSIAVPEIIELDKHAQKAILHQIEEKQEHISATFPDIIGNTPIMKKLFREILQLAQTEANTLIYGESGTGKELVARAIHQNSRRRNHRLITVECSSLPENLLESELFGHEEGAFTGARKRKRGLIEYGNKGTCFFDEITEMSLSLQAKLLRVLQEREFRRVGSNEPVKVDIRIISATNRDPDEAVRNGVIREDLYYRLRVVPLRVPALRERKDDIPLLCDHFLNEFKKKNSIQVETFSVNVIEHLKNYYWPGNVRELKGLVERLAVTIQKEIIETDDLPEEILSSPIPVPQNEFNGIDYNSAKQKHLEAFQETYFKQLFEKHDGNISKIAREADLSRPAVYKILKSINFSSTKEFRNREETTD